MKTGQLFELDATLHQVGNQPGLRGFMFPHAVRVVRKALEQYLAPAAETRETIFQEFGKKDESGRLAFEEKDGMIVVPWIEGKGDEANKAMQELYDTPVQLKNRLPTIKTRLFEEAGVSVTEQMIAVLDPVLANSE